jgi:NADP-dependent 3-hydroxy acid dehydrogenase YdfG
VLFTVQRMLPLLVDGASVILTGSMASVVAMPAFSVYGASKAAVRCLPVTGRSISRGAGSGSMY